MIDWLPGVRTVNQLMAFRKDPLSQLAAMREHGPVVPLEFGPFDVLAVFAPGPMHHVLQHPDQFDKSTRAMRVARSLLGNGLLTSQGEVWRARRRIAQPAFRTPRLSVYTRIMQDVTNETATRWRTSTEPIDLNREMMQLALQVATRSLFVDHFEGEAEALDRALGRVLHSFQRMVTQPLARPESLPFGPAVTYRRAIAEIDAIVSRLVARRRARGSDGDDLLHLWLHSGLTDDEIREEVVTMLLAAHETTANALTWAWLHVLRFPTALRAIRSEVAELGGPDAVVDLPARAGALPWTDAVISETLRLYPPAWATSRSATEPGQLELEGRPPVELRSGTVLMLCLHAMHRDPTHWSHPEAFDPERWLLDPEQGGVHGRTFPDLAYAPFGAGQRKCIGSHFAVLEARIALATLACAVDLDLLSGREVGTSAAVTLRPDGPVWARVYS